MSAQVRLRLLPSARCLFDEPIQVKVAGLRPKQEVTVEARSTDEKGVLFSSSATYRADRNGEIHLDRDVSLGGSYCGVEPMGLLWSMKPAVLFKRFQRMNALNPHIVNFSVHEGGEEKRGRMLAEAENERLLMRDGVRRVPVRQGNIYGVLFTPPGSGPFPAVLDLYTSGGGLSERRASLLANRGFVVLTTSLYGQQEQPKDIQGIHLDYFEEAIEFLKKQEKVGSKGVGVMSLSKSADLALSIASYLPSVDAVIWINGCSANTVLPLFYKTKQILPALMFDTKKLLPTQSGAFIAKYAMHDPLKEENRATLIPIEQANTHFLFVASEDDLNWDSKAYMIEMVERLKHCGKQNFESVCYPGAGHYLEPPYGPYCPSSYHMHAKQRVMWGGEAGAHAAAEVHMWKKIQEFLRTHLRCDAAQTNAKL
ncbi:acyl-coenzyme A thioesterase 5-like [Oryzias latipes]